MKIIKPIIIISPGRGGSTIFHRLLSEHPNVAWLSRLADYAPSVPQVNGLVMAMIDMPFLGRRIRNALKTSEAYNLWEYYCTGFRRPHRDLNADDLTPLKKKRVLEAFSKVLTKKKNRLMLKITGWPRIDYLKAIFPDALFIHVIRDGRAVVNSYLNVDFWQGWSGPSNWRYGPLNAEYNKIWNKYDQSFVALAAIQWMMYVDAFRKSDSQAFHKVRYEDLCENSVSVMKGTTDFCQLNWDRSIEKRIRKYALRNTDHKWQSQLSHKQQGLLNEILTGHLTELGYN